MQQGDFRSSYCYQQQNPNQQNPSNLVPPDYSTDASAPPFSTNSDNYLQKQQPPSPSLYEPHDGSYPPLQHSYYPPPFDHHQPPPSYPPPSSILPNPNPYSSLSAPYYTPVGTSLPSTHETPHHNYLNYHQQPPPGPFLYHNSIHGAPDPKSSTRGATFDDFGRYISVPSSGPGQIVRAVPQAEAQQDVNGGVQKFKVKLLAEASAQTNMDVLCQIGLDGIRMLDPNTNRTLRIYPLDTIIRCEAAGPSILAFWSKSSVDIEPRRIRLQSSTYTTNTILDTVTAATVQLKEMGGRSRPSDVSKTTEHSTDKKKGFTDWMIMMKPTNEEKEHWVPDEAVSKCTACGNNFGAFLRRHHCRNCGDIFCDKCTHGRIALTIEENAPPVRVCDRCLAEVTQRLSNAKEAANKPVLQSHEDLARKLQDEMERNHKSTAGTKSDGSGRRMREVACPICTVHLQVQVPSSGSETIECGVCQHPFLVGTH